MEQSREKMDAGQDGCRNQSDHATRSEGSAAKVAEQWGVEDDPGSPVHKSDSTELIRTAVATLVEEVVGAEKQRIERIEAATSVLNIVCGPRARLVKATSSGGRLIFVLDGAVCDSVCEQLYDCLQTDAFRRTEFASPDTREFRHHVVEYNVQKLMGTELYKVVKNLVDAFFPNPASQLEVYRIYTNAVMFGDAAFAHRDSDNPKDVTVLVYPNPSWASELGGETIFYDEDGEIVEAVEPRPGRLVLFRGCILHKGSPPSRLFWGSRYTTALKFAPADSAEDEVPQSTKEG